MQCFPSSSRVHTSTWMLSAWKRKLDSNCTRMLQAILNKYWKQHPTKQQLHGHLPPISKTIQIRQTRHAGHFWWSKGKLISNVLLWTPSHRWAGVGHPARTYLKLLCIDMGCSLETCWIWWMIEMNVEGELEKSVLAAWYDDDYCVEQATVFVWIENRKIVYQCVI